MSETNVIEELIIMRSKGVDGTIYRQRPLVRCKDCVHWDKGCTEECDNSDSVCFHNGWCKPDWFCADGERR